VKGAAECCEVVSEGPGQGRVFDILMKPTLRPGWSCILPSSIFDMCRIEAYELGKLVGSLFTNSGLSSNDLVLCPRGHHVHRMFS
jgi:hypothetical protein